MHRALSRLKVEDLTTANDAMKRCLRLAALAATTDVPVVLLGETGTGKTLLAHAIHNSSDRADRAFVAFNASAMSDTLIESQLFGHERGAFTGAQQTVKGNSSWPAQSLRRKRRKRATPSSRSDGQVLLSLDGIWELSPPSEP